MHNRTKMHAHADPCTRQCELIRDEDDPCMALLNDARNAAPTASRMSSASTSASSRLAVTAPRVVDPGVHQRPVAAWQAAPSAAMSAASPTSQRRPCSCKHCCYSSLLYT